MAAPTALLFAGRGPIRKQTQNEEEKGGEKTGKTAVADENEQFPSLRLKDNKEAKEVVGNGEERKDEDEDSEVVKRLTTVASTTEGGGSRLCAEFFTKKV